MTSTEIGRYYTEDSNRRIVTLDFLRGVAIWLMIFFHASTHLYDYSWFADN
ncbi:MAG: heparan-alpha-glucosaminide N-acetyltransferase domain-containing protein, partial [Candidatus Heimdallarchaeaceae archaeon]